MSERLGKREGEKKEEIESARKIEREGVKVRKRDIERALA